MDNPSSEQKQASSYIAIYFVGIFIGIIICVAIWGLKKLFDNYRLRLLDTEDNSSEETLIEHLPKTIISKPIQVGDFENYVFANLKSQILKQHAIVASKCQNFNNSRSQLSSNFTNLQPGFVKAYNGEKLITIAPPTGPEIKNLWYFIWKERISIIVMLSGRTAYKYWPEENEKLKIGHITVENNELITCNSHIKQKLKITYLGRSREIIHFYYRGWMQNIFNFDCLILFMKDFMETYKDGSILFHCKNNYQRSSIIILSMMVLQMAKSEQQVDFIRLLTRIKIQNQLLLKHNIDYILSHLLVLQYLNYEDFSVAIDDNFKENVLKLLSSDRIRLILKRLETADRIYNILDQLYNYSYSRQVRVSFSDISFYVQTQPDKSAFSIINFWQNVLNTDTSLIVTLNHVIPDNSTELSTNFWPENFSTKFSIDDELFVKNIKDVVRNSFYNKYELRVSLKNESRNITLVCLKNWEPKKIKPKYFEGLIYIWKETFDHYTKHKKDILVTCYDGASASGLFIALCYLIDKMQKSRVCDTFSVIKEMRRYNSEFVTRWEHIEILYKAAMAYVVKFEETDYDYQCI